MTATADLAYLRNKPFPGQAIYSGHPRTWAEAEVLAEPVKNASAPIVLVRRRDSGLVSPDNADLAYFDRPPAISTFTGCGGMDLGIDQAGFMVVVQHESDELCCQTLIANRPNCFRHAALIQGDIRVTPTSMLLREANLRVGEAHLVTGGPPCQGFSTSGKRDLKDFRNTLIFEFLRVVREAQPSFFLFENVPGFVTLAQGAFFEAFLREAHAGYYELVYGLLDAAEYGVPQHRVRFFCSGTRRDLAEIEGVLGSLPKPQCFSMGDLKVIRAGGEQAERLMHAPGIRYFSDRPVLRPPAPTARISGARTKTFLKFYEQLERDEPDRIVRDPVNTEAR